MQKIKTRLCCLFLFVCFLPLSACIGEKWMEELPSQWFTSELLADYGVEDLPSPPIETGRLRTNNATKETFYFYATYDEVQTLAREILEYLRANENVYHLCELQGHGGLVAEMLPYDNYLPVTDEFVFEESAYVFAYSLSPELANFGGYLPALRDPILISIAFTGEDTIYKGTFVKPFKYNATVIIKKQGWGACAILYDEE